MSTLRADSMVMRRMAARAWAGVMLGVCSLAKVMAASTPQSSMNSAIACWFLGWPLTLHSAA
ncbi:hypothetical protein D3C71_2224060 [compost metagenome]